MNLQRLPLVVVAFLFLAFSLSGLTPDDERWELFIAGHTGVSAVAEDVEMGLLADLRNPGPEWEEAIEVCESVFSALETGTLPSDFFHPLTRTALVFAFENIFPLESQEFDHRYGRPTREGQRMTIPVRVQIADGDGPVYGYIYMLRSDGVWYVEQWALDLSGFSQKAEIE